MNTTRSTTASSTAATKLAQSIGNAAAYGFWISSILAVAGTVLAFLAVGSAAIALVGSFLSFAVVAMIGSILAMALSARFLKSRGEF